MRKSLAEHLPGSSSIECHTIIEQKSTMFASRPGLSAHGKRERSSSSPPVMSQDRDKKIKLEEIEEPLSLKQAAKMDQEGGPDDGDDQRSLTKRPPEPVNKREFLESEAPLIPQHASTPNRQDALLASSPERVRPLVDVLLSSDPVSQAYITAIKDLIKPVISLQNGDELITAIESACRRRASHDPAEIEQIMGDVHREWNLIVTTHLAGLISTPSMLCHVMVDLFEAVERRGLLVPAPVTAAAHAIMHGVSDSSTIRKRTADVNSLMSKSVLTPPEVSPERESQPRIPGSMRKSLLVYVHGVPRTRKCKSRSREHRQERSPVKTSWLSQTAVLAAKWSTRTRSPEGHGSWSS